MAQIITYDADRGLREGISGAGNILASALMKRGERRALSSFEDEESSLETSYQRAIQAGANPQSAMQFYAMKRQQRSDNASKSALDVVLSSGEDLYSPKGRDIFLQNYVQAGGSLPEGISMMPKLEKQKEVKSIVDKKIEENMATNVIDLVHGGSKLGKAEENLNWLEGNIENVGRLKSLVNIGPFQNQKFAEFRNRGNLALDPVIHVFNKSGVVPKEKLQWMRDTFAIDPTDTQEQIRGKINALKSLSRGGIAFEKGLQSLLDKYGTDIPINEYVKLAKETDSFVDSFINDYSSGNLKTETKETPVKSSFEKPPAASSVKQGQKIRDKKTGQILISNGKKWVKAG